MQLFDCEDGGSERDKWGGAWKEEKDIGVSYEIHKETMINESMDPSITSLKSRPR